MLLTDKVETEDVGWNKIADLPSGYGWLKALTVSRGSQVIRSIMKNLCGVLLA